MRILMVCLGNICRSPLAEGILQHKANTLDKNWQVDSAGMGDWHAGELPDRRSMAIARQNGIDISYQRARQFQVSDFDTFDRIYAMDSDNYSALARKARHDDDRNKIELIMNELWPGQNRHVPDPYYGGPEGFEQVFNMLDAACAAILEKYDQ